MIRKYADRTDWGRIVEKQFTVVSKKTIGFSGTVTLFEMLKVKAPLYKQYGPEHTHVCIASDGYKWLQHFPEYAHYTLSSMYDNENRVVQWYVDICKCQGTTEAGIPWYDDLFLNIVILPGGQIYVLHKERLEEALQRGELNASDYELAWKTCNQVVEEYRNGSFDLLLLADMHLQELNEGS